MSLNSYTAFTTVAALLGISWALWRAPRSGHTRSRSATLNGLLVVALAALIAGRLGYGLLHPDYFREHPAELFSVSSITSPSPGYSEQAALAGGLLGWGIARRLRQRVDVHALVVIATLIGIGASIGCIPHGCAYGREVFWTDGWLWLLRVDWPDAYTINNPRLPSQAFTVAWLLLCFFITLVIGKRFAQRWNLHSDSAAILFIWLLLFALGDLAIQFTRADPTAFFAGGRAGQWMDTALVLASIIGLVRTIKKSKVPTLM